MEFNPPKTMSDFKNLLLSLQPDNNDPCYEGDYPWDIPFPSIPKTITSPLFKKNTVDYEEGDCDDPTERIEDVRTVIQYLHDATTWWKTKAEIHGQFMDELKMKLAKATMDELEATLLAESRATKLKELEIDVEKAKEEAIADYRRSTPFKDELKSNFNEGFNLCRDVASLMEMDKGSDKLDGWTEAFAESSQNPENKGAK